MSTPSSQSNQRLSTCLDIIREFHDSGRGNASYNSCVKLLKIAQDTARDTAKHHDGVAEMNSGLAVYAFATPFILIIGEGARRFVL